MSTHSHDHDHHQHHDHHHDDHDHHQHSSEALAATSWIGPDGKKYHTHDGLAPHSHEPLYSPGYFSRRACRLPNRDFKERAFTIGIGGPVGTGKTALMLALCQVLRDKYSIAAVTNDIFTKEDGEFLVKHGALPAERIRAVETGGCPHAAIREDISINLGPLEELSNLFTADILLCESGGDNLAANFSRELADYIIYIIDVSGGDKIPRKGGPGITQADLLVINKTDLAAAIGADLKVMERDSLQMRAVLLGDPPPKLIANDQRSTSKTVGATTSTGINSTDGGQLSGDREAGRSLFVTSKLVYRTDNGHFALSLKNREKEAFRLNSGVGIRSLPQMTHKLFWQPVRQNLRALGSCTNVSFGASQTSQLYSKHFSRGVIREDITAWMRQ